MLKKTTAGIKRYLPITYLKIQRDMIFSPARSLMLITALAIGAFAVGTMLGAMSTLRREMQRNYLSTNPASATLRLDTPLSREASLEIAKIPGIRVAEPHRVVRSRMFVNGDAVPILLFVIPDFNSMRLNIFFRESGSWPPPRGTMLVERTALRVMQARPGDSITVRTPHGAIAPVSISGVVHDPGLAPAWQEQTGYGYITRETLRLLGEETGWNEMRLAIDPSLNAETVARRAATRLTEMGMPVREIQIPPPGRHPHQGQMEAVLTMFLAFSVLTLTLSAILTTAVISTLMVRQMREIGVMKASGARTGRLVLMYTGMIALTAALALIVAAPTSQIVARLLVHRIAQLLNLEILDASAPWWVFLIQAMATFAFPVVAALWPVWRSSRIPVRDALDYRGKLVTLPPGMVQRLPVPLRNALRNPARFAVSAGLLAVAGALFMSALNVSAAWKDKLADIERFRSYDVEVRLFPGTQTKALLSEMKGMPGLEFAEEWTTDATGFYDGSPFVVERTYPDQGHGSFSLVTLPASTPLVHFPLLTGRWLNNTLHTDQRVPGEAVFNHGARDRALSQGIDPSPGNTLRITHGGIVSTIRIVGIVEDIGSQATIYMNREESMKTNGETILIRASFRDRNADAIRQNVQAIEGIMDRLGIPVDMIFATNALKNAVGEHMTVLISTLSAAAILMATVGFLGLVSTMTMNIVERTREIGILRAVGGQSSTIRQLLLFEGAWTVAGSFPLALALSLLLSHAIGSLVGNMAFRTPLSLTADPAGIVVWTCVLLVGTLISVWIPVRQALAIPARTALAFEG